MAQGRGGKFSIVPLLLNIGSGLGLLAVVCYLSLSFNVFCHFMVFNLSDSIALKIITILWL